MTVIIGEPAEQATAIISGSGKELAVQFEATWAGAAEEATLEELHIIPSLTWTGTANVFLGIAADNAGAPGTVLGTAESAEKPKEKVPFALAGFSVKLKKGTKYWLIALNGGAAANEAKMLGKSGGTSTQRNSTAKLARIETVSEWGVAQAKGPVSFWGTGTEAAGGGPVTVTPAVASSESNATAPLTVSVGPGAVTVVPSAAQSTVETGEAMVGTHAPVAPVPALSGSAASAARVGNPVAPSAGDKKLLSMLV